MADPAQLALLEHFRVARRPTSADNRRRGEAEWVRHEEVLGYGACSIVYLETDSRTGAARAVKEVRKRANPNFKQELIALTRLSRPAYTENFGQFLGWWETDSIVAYILPYFEHGDLRKFMDTSWQEEDAKDIASQLLSGLSLMHQDGFTHRDLKPENIFVAHTKPFFKVKIGDFGVSKRVFDKTLMLTFVGTRNYLAPEVLELLDGDADDDWAYTNAVDIWAVGGIIFELLTTLRPFKSRRELTQYYTGKLQFPAEPLTKVKLSSRAQEFVAHLLAPQPTERPDAKTALANPWFEVVTNQSQPNEEKNEVSAPPEESAGFPTSPSQGLGEELENIHVSSPHDDVLQDSDRITNSTNSTMDERAIGRHDSETLERLPPWMAQHIVRLRDGGYASKGTADDDKTRSVEENTKVPNDSETLERLPPWTGQHIVRLRDGGYVLKRTADDDKTRSVEENTKVPNDSETLEKLPSWMSQQPIRQEDGIYVRTKFADNDKTRSVGENAKGPGSRPNIDQRFPEKGEDRNSRRAAETPQQVSSTTANPRLAPTIDESHSSKAQDTNMVAFGERLKNMAGTAISPSRAPITRPTSQGKISSLVIGKPARSDGQGSSATVVARPSIWRPVKSGTTVPPGVKTVTDPSGKYRFFNPMDRTPFWVDPGHPQARPELGPLPIGWQARTSRWSKKLEFYNYISKTKTPHDPRLVQK